MGSEGQHPTKLPWRLTAILLTVLLCSSTSAETHLTVENVRSLALEFNRTYLAALQDVQIAKSEIGKAWSEALPKVRFDGDYNHNYSIPRMFIVWGNETVEMQTGFKNSFGGTVSVRQSLWHGGKVLTGLEIAKLYRSYSEAISIQVEVGVIFNAKQLFYSTILARSRLDVLQIALESNSANLEVVEKLYSQGMVSEFEVLRSRVEKQNLLPQILQSEAEVRLSEKRLKSFIGLDLEESVTLIEDQTDTSVARIPVLPELIDVALAERPEVHQAQHLVGISRKAVRVARADYFPSLDAVGAYDWRSVSDKYTMSGNQSSSWTAGLTVSFSIFDGGETRSQVSRRIAENHQANLNLAQIEDDIRLEVEQAYDLVLQSKKALDIQGATIASAEEGLRIAQVRYESGVGTQLEVLSAQTALTTAREAQAEALYAFRTARAGLEKATTLDMDADKD